MNGISTLLLIFKIRFNINLCKGGQSRFNLRNNIK